MKQTKYLSLLFLHTLMGYLDKPVDYPIRNNHQNHSTRQDPASTSICSVSFSALEVLKMIPQFLATQIVILIAAFCKQGEEMYKRKIIQWQRVEKGQRKSNQQSKLKTFGLKIAYRRVSCQPGIIFFSVIHLIWIFIQNIYRMSKNNYKSLGLILFSPEEPNKTYPTILFRFQSQYPLSKRLQQQQQMPRIGFEPIEINLIQVLVEKFLDLAPRVLVFAAGRSLYAIDQEQIIINGGKKQIAYQFDIKSLAPNVLIQQAPSQPIQKARRSLICRLQNICGGFQWRRWLWPKEVCRETPFFVSGSLQLRGLASKKEGRGCLSVGVGQLNCGVQRSEGVGV